MINEMRQGFETAYIDGSVVSNAAYRPQFVSNNHKEGKKVLSSIEDELLACDQFQISVAFITMSGITPLLQTLQELEKKKIPGQILTTNYLNFSEPRALKKLNELSNITLKMYDVEAADEGFHTKGYIFRKEEVYRIIIGSSNITSSALTSNREWNTKLVSTEQGEMAQQIVAEFTELWNSQYALGFDEFYEAYIERYKIIKHQREIAKQEEITSIEKYKLQPNSMQVGFITNLKKILAAEENNDRALLISATGTGKTYASAFAMRELGFKRVLFLVHRDQLARQTKKSYEKVFAKSVSMGLVGAGYDEYDADYVFATVQTLSRDEHLLEYDPKTFDCIVLDEVHHAVSDEIKLRAVVTRWAQNHTVNSVIGFSGTPYLDKVEKIKVVDSLFIGTAEITNIVYYYPLIDGVGNFLKRPVVKIADIADSSLIIEKGVREFLDTYKDTVYADGLTAKLGIYCGTIEKLEETVYPQVSRIVAEYGLGTDVILKFHKGNKQYKMSADSQMQFDILDKSISEIRIVLLVQIGKEGWDCRSLTGIILSQEGDCPTNMVLQTSCRCLRQVIKNGQETALIYLNESNAEKLNIQLERQHHISLKEFSSADNSKTTLKRYNRTAYLKLPKVEFYQLKISYDTLTVEKANPEVSIEKSVDSAQIAGNIIKTTDLSMNVNNISIQVDDAEYGTEYATFNSWIYGIMRSGFGTPSMAELNAYTEQLKVVYEKITYEKGGSRYFSSKYNKKLVEANIRKAFCDKTDFNTTEELIPEEANLLNIANFTSEIYADNLDDYYPRQED